LLWSGLPAQPDEKDRRYLTYAPLRWVVGAITLLAAAALVYWSAALSVQSPAKSEPDLLHLVYRRFDSVNPGRGVADYPGNPVADIPKSYAMLLIAELERTRNSILPDLPNLAGKSGRWLLDNSTLRGNEVVGWGVPIGWDAYGDNSENPPNTIYSISTAIVIDALLTWMETDPQSPGDEILDEVSAAALAFLNGPRTPDGMLPYSLEASDAAYDTFNSAAYLAGQFQRLSKYVADKDVADELRSAADTTVSSLIRHRKTSPSGAWYWNYSVQENQPNDLPHAMYIVLGLQTYAREGGRLRAQIDIPQTINHIRDFLDDQQQPRAWPIFRTDVNSPPRLYDVGIALTLACSNPELDDVSKRFLDTVETYKTSDSMFAKLPRNYDPNALVINEYEAYLWTGLVSCASRDKAASVTLTEGTPAAVTHALAAGPSDHVPFVRLGTENREVRVDFDQDRATFGLPWDDSIEVSLPGIPEQLFADDAGGVAIVRKIPGNALALTPFDKHGKTLPAIEISHSPNSNAIFRGAVFTDGVLALVYYDNPTLANYLVRYKRSAGGYERVGTVTKLPSLRDPAGATYEMIPPVFLLPSEKGLFVVGGATVAQFGSDPTPIVTKLEGCLKILEAVATPEGPVSLCQRNTENSKGELFFLQGPSGRQLPRLAEDAGVPFGLQYSGDKVTISFANTPGTFAQMLKFDLERANRGWLEYGIDNVEGRIAWSQIYYLNGFLDFLYLAQHPTIDWAAFSPLLEQMRTRLDQEFSILNSRWLDGGYATRAFSVDRSLALFAVQTSRLALLFHRYLNELVNPEPLSGYEDLIRRVGALTGHIETMADSGQQANWLPPGARYLKWPKGSVFSFDGLNVPYNHQNEWAYSASRIGYGLADDRVSHDIVSHFLRRIAPKGYLPLLGTWDYWWGQAYDGWTQQDGISHNKPEYKGDHIKAWISFRSIDTMSMLANAPALDRSTRENLMRSSAYLISTGNLYPFVSYELRKQARVLKLPKEIALKYIRISSPWEVQNAAWAYESLLGEAQSQKAN